MTPRENVEIVDEEFVTTLIFPQVVKKDAGKYEVCVTNEGGEARTSGSVRVIGKS